MVMGSNFGDFDNDGFFDFYVGMGVLNFMVFVFNCMFCNCVGKVFEDVMSVGGFGYLQKGYGIVFVDFDSDGDQDVYVVMGGVYFGDGYCNVFFENFGSEGVVWIILKFEGRVVNCLVVGV